MSDEVLAWLSVWSEVQVIGVWCSWCHCHLILSCFIKIQIGLIFLVPDYPGCPENEAINRCLGFPLLVFLHLFQTCVFSQDRPILFMSLTPILPCLHRASPLISAQRLIQSVSLFTTLKPSESTFGVTRLTGFSANSYVYVYWMATVILMKLYCIVEAVHCLLKAIEIYTDMVCNIKQLVSCTVRHWF